MEHWLEREIALTTELHLGLTHWCQPTGLYQKAHKASPAATQVSDFKNPEQNRVKKEHYLIRQYTNND